MTINRDGYGLPETWVAAIEEIVNAVAPGAAGVSSVGGASGVVTLRTVGGFDLTDGGGDIDVGGTSGGAGGTSTTFALAIKYDLDYRYYPTVHDVSGDETYTQDTAGAIPGGGTSFTIRMDGTHTVNLTALGTKIGSQAIVNTDGQQHTISAWKDPSGGGYYYGIALGAVNDTTAPTLSSASVANDAPDVVALVFSENMDTSSTPSAGDITFSAGSSVSVAWFSDTICLVTVTPAFVFGDVKTVTYTGGTNKFKDDAGNLVANFSAHAITNNVEDVPHEGALAATAITMGTAFDLDTGYADWVLYRSGIGDSYVKLLAELITTDDVLAGGTVGSNSTTGFSSTFETAFPDLTATDAATFADPETLSVDFTPNGEMTGVSANCTLLYAATGAPTRNFRVPAGLTERTVHLFWGSLRDSDFSLAGDTAIINLSLSDASATPVTLTSAAAASNHQVKTYHHEIVYTAAADGEELIIGVPLINGVYAIRAILLES